jgi:hypothetical protein
LLRAAIPSPRLAEGRGLPLSGFPDLLRQPQLFFCPFTSWLVEAVVAFPQEHLQFQSCSFRLFFPPLQMTSSLPMKLPTKPFVEERGRLLEG